MARFMIFGLLMTGLCLVVPTSSEKQIKLEDIEKDNLKAAQQAKLEKQYQQFQYQYEQAPVQYEQLQSQQGLSYPSAYYQYSLPQQYVQQQQAQLYSGYAPLSSNTLGAGYPAASAVHPFQAYYTPQLTPAVQSGQHIAAPTQTQPIIMTIPSQSLAGLQQQAYYQVLPKTLSSFGGVHYVSSQTTQPVQYYYQPQAQTTAPTAGSSLVQYIPSYQYLAGNKLGAYQQQFVSTAPQTFSQSYSTSSSDYSASYPAQASTYSTNPAYTQSEQPTFVSLKAPQHLVASPGQQQQYLQAQVQTTTVSPFKYLNSPQYLAQNYNTIQSSHLLPKNSLSSGVKSTVGPPLKFTGNTGYVSSSSNSGSSNYHTYRGIAG